MEALGDGERCAHIMFEAEASLICCEVPSENIVGKSVDELLR